jgi:hypothetical protein
MAVGRIMEQFCIVSMRRLFVIKIVGAKLIIKIEKITLQCYFC